jgi:hypothetical protein
MLWITEKYVDATKGQIYSVVDWYETRYEDDGLQALMRSSCKTFGRIRSMWRDRPGGGRRQVGWVFERRVPYEDARPDWPRKDRTYLREVWIEVSIGDPRQATPAPVIVSPWVERHA